MYSLFHPIETVSRFVFNKCKIVYWKLKYGKRFQVGKNMRFRRGMVVNISKDGCLKIGDNCFFNNYCSINCHKKIVIGNDNLFGEGVKIYDHNHVFNDKDLNLRTNFKEDIINIGNDNWFGSNVVILRKASVGDMNVFGANTIINSRYGSKILVRLFNNQKDEIIDYCRSEKNHVSKLTDNQAMHRNKKGKEAGDCR